MLNNLTGFDNIFIACGYTNLRSGIDTLATIVQQKYKINPYNEKSIFLFCGRKRDRIKALVWEGDGFILLYKRLEKGAYIWPRNYEDLKCLKEDEFKRLISGFSIESSIERIKTPMKTL